MDVKLENVHIGQRVRRGHNWRSRWRDDKRGYGVVVGYSDENGCLVGRNTNGSYYDAFYVLDSKKVSVGGGWCAVRWSESSKESIYPIGARGPLGNWWPNDCECYSLVTPEGVLKDDDSDLSISDSKL